MHGPVTASAEFRRIQALPRRKDVAIDAELLTRHLKTPHGQQALWQNQAACLADLYDNYQNAGGLFGIQPVGAGKTLILLLAPVLVGAQRPLYLVPANLLKKTIVEIPQYAQHWNLHPRMRLESNQRLQVLKNKDLLLRYMPDLILLDEAHEYRNRKAARTIRLIKYLKEYPNTKLVVLSGTLTKRSIKDYWHLIRITHRERCPLPLFWNELTEWSEALDEDIPENKKRSGGALHLLCNEGENLRQGFSRRLIETSGVVALEAPQCPASLNIFERPPLTIPPELVKVFEIVRNKGETPSGDILTDRMNIWRRCKELAFGFYYRWVWPNNVPDLEWLQRRRRWRRFIRKTIKDNRRGIDSELGVSQAADRGEFDDQDIQLEDGKWTLAKHIRDEWYAVRDRWKPHPPREAVWVSDVVLQDAARWAKEEENLERGIIWVEHQAVGERLSAMTGLPYYGAGNEEILSARSICIASMWAHGKGKNLQHFTNNLMLASPSGGDVCEQLIGRTHRSGQTADEINFEMYMHCLELWQCFDKARSDARYIQDMMNQKQKLCLATVSVMSEGEMIQRTLANDPLWGKTQ